MKAVVLLRKTANKLSWLKEDITWLWRRIFINRRLYSNSDENLVIGIATYKDRFYDHFRPLLRKLHILFPDSRYIVIANGHVLKEEQNQYISKITEFCGKFKRVRLITFTDPVGLSNIWNLIIDQSGANRILILNDDVMIKLGFRAFIMESGLLGEQIATINSSWSHFLITREVTENIGLFDEGLKEIGGEDDDYLARLAMNNIKPGNFLTPTIAGKGKRRGLLSKINSYGKDMSKELGGYSTLNTMYIHKKWQTSDEYFDGAVEVPGRKIRFWKLREES